MVFHDRADAGRKLAISLKSFAGQADVLLYALPRGGVVIGKEVADALRLPLDVIVTRKIALPSNEEYAIGALSETGELVWNEAERAAANPAELEQAIREQQAEAVRRVQTYRHGTALPSFAGKRVLLLDDGIATGLTMQAAIAAARHQDAKEIHVAVPHGAKDSIAEMRRQGVDVIALAEPSWYGSVGQYYDVFPQTSDEEVLRILHAYEKA